VLVLQHPQEVGHAKGSLPLLQASLTHCQVLVGERFDPEVLAQALAPHTQAGPSPVQSLLLYPDSDPAGPPVPACSALPQPRQLVLLDASWRKSRKMLQTNPALQALPRWGLPAPPPSRYGIRRAQGVDQRSTLEAACLALGLLEGRPTHYAPLLQAFSGWVDERVADGFMATQG
jgi:DTW domain-containing protein YfiP